MKALIIDDESKARTLLSAILEQSCPSILESETAKDLLSGIEKIRSFQPDIVFLDIEMPQHNGLKILEFLGPDEINFEIIFTTAYSEYALKAFDLNAVSYLLKPLQPEMVNDAVLKAQKQLSKEQVDQRLSELKKTLASKKFQKIGLPVGDGILFVPFEEIIMLKADGMYTKIHCQGKGELTISKPLKYFCDLLLNQGHFYRSHRSYVINLLNVKQYVKKDGGYIIMDNDQMAAISSDKKEEFVALMTTS